MGKYIMGIDVGTTGAKAIIFDYQGNAIASGYQEYSCFYPHSGWVEQDINLLTQCVYTCSKQATAQVDAAEIEAVSISTQRSCTVFVDKDGNALKMISWMDNRATEQVEQLETIIGREHFYDIVGLPLCATWILPKVLHTRQNDPELWAKTARICQMHEMILRALGVDGFYSDEPEACMFGLWDNRNFTWNEEILDATGITTDMLPEMRQPGECMGSINADISAKTGLAVGTKICIGLGDQNSAALGAGLAKVGYASVSIGTGGIATGMLENCWRDPQKQTMVTTHAQHGMWTFEGLQNAAAGVFRWFRDEIATHEKSLYGDDVYNHLNKLMADVPVGANGLIMLPHFAGAATPRWCSEARGVFLGLSFAHTKAHMARACIEGITLEQKDILCSMQNSTGAKFHTVRIMGGATNSPLWNQIQADIYNIPCETLQVKDAAVLGAALCAATCTGKYKNFVEAITGMVHVDKRYEPIPKNAAKYQDVYTAYTTAFEALRQGGAFAALGALHD